MPTGTPPRFNLSATPGVDPGAAAWYLGAGLVIAGWYAEIRRIVRPRTEDD